MDQPILFMGTPSFAVPTLAALLEAGWPIVGVVCQPDRPAGRGQKLTPPPVKELALAHGLTVYQPERIKRNPEFIDQLKALNPALIVVVAYGNLLPQELLDIPRYGCLNVHASILPRYRGAAPIQWSVINGDAVTGVTLMKMDLGMDTGDMLAIAELPIAPEDTAETISPRLAALGARLAVDKIPDWIAGKLTPQPQDNAQATMAPKLSKELGVLDWRKDARTLHNLVRGVQPWPGASTTLLGAPIKVVQTAIGTADTHGASPGTILALRPDGWEVATGRGSLILSIVQPPGKPARPAADVARGWRDVQVGAQLGELAETAGA